MKTTRGSNSCEFEGAARKWARLLSRAFFLVKNRRILYAIIYKDKKLKFNKKMEKMKKIIIVAVVFVILVAAFVTVITFQGKKVVPIGKNSSVGFPEGIASEPIDSSYPGGVSNMAGKSFSLGAPIASPSISQSDSVLDKKIIKNGSLNLKVSNADQANQDIVSIAKSNGGDVFSSNVYNRNNIKSGMVTVKVPVANFEKTFAEIKKVAALVIQESTSGQDVTEEYADLQAQLKNKQAEEQQFVEIMKQAQKIQDILDVTEQLSRVRGEIEQLQGRIKFLDSQTDMASISVSLSEDQNIIVSDSWRPWQVIKDAANALIRKIQGFVNFAIVLIITVIPVAILYLLLAYLIYAIGKKIYVKIKNKKQ